MGIYTTLEDKWYDLVDWLNQYVPVGGVVDSVDRVVPSFILFLALLLLFFVGLFAFLFVSGGITGSVFDAEVTVLSRQGAPVSGAVILFSQSCLSEGDITLKTNSEGKAVFRACSDSADLRVSKEGYSTQSESVSFEESKARIYLSQLTSQQRVVNVKVKDSSRKIVTNAELFLLCVKGSKLEEKLIQSGDQSSVGFMVTIPSECDSIQLKATANGFSEKKELLGLNEENKTITLEKVDLSGTVVFEVDSNSGKKEAIISVTDQFGKQDTIIVDSTGNATRQYNSGNYSYTAVLFGFEKKGSFEITTTQTTTVELFFNEVTNTSIIPILNGTALGVYLKILDGNSPVAGATVRLFYKKGNDVNQLPNLFSRANGLVGHYPVSDTNNRRYYAIIKSLEYESKFIEIDLKTELQSPQEVVLSKGGADLKVKVVDDVNNPIQDMTVSIWKSTFPGTFDDSLITDKNGLVTFKSLPNGTYKIRAVSNTHEGEMDSISVLSDKTVVLKVITGTGSVRFNLLNKGNSVNAYCELLEKTSDGNILVSSTTTTNGYYKVSSLKAEKNVYLAVPDNNFIYSESPIVTVKRGDQSRDVILYKQSDLPNLNKLQMFLEGVYESNPWVGSESKATKLMPGRKYYFLFTLITNNISSMNTTANVFVSPRDKNVIDANTKLFLQDAFSTRTSIVQTSLAMNSSIIPYDPINSSNPKNAKQLNVYFGEVSGPRAFPILVELTVDVNARGSTALYWEGIAGDNNDLMNNSILYSKEFVIGESFCFGARKCPEILFSNYIKRVGTNDWVPFENYSAVQLEELYDLNIVVENLTDKEIGASSITGIVGPNSKTKIQFENDSNSISSNVLVTQFGKAWAKLTVEPLKVDPSATIIESLVKGNELNDYNGNNKSLRFNIKNKEDIGIDIIATSTPGVIYSKSEYPLFYIKAYYKSLKRAVPNANIVIKLKESNVYLPYTPITDENGEWLGEIDLSQYETGTILVFTATDANNSNPGYLEVTLVEGYSDPTTQTVPDCITIKIKKNGTYVDIKSESIPFVTAEVGSIGEDFVLDSNCIEDREILIRSDLGVSPSNRFTLRAGASQTVTVNNPASVAISRGQRGVAGGDAPLLGAYPLQINQIVNRKFNQIGFIDVIVKDSSGVFGGIFSIENPILDMRGNNSASSKIINLKLGAEGRKDIYYPQMDISTNSVGLAYTKPGIPEKVKFNAVVKSHAVEALTTAYNYSSEINQSNRKNKCRSVTNLVLPNSFIFSDLAEQHSELKIDTLTSKISAARAIITPDADDRDPTKSLYTLPVPIQNKIKSELYPTTGTLSKTLTLKNSNAFFAEDDEDDESEFDEVLYGNPLRPSTGDKYEIIPEMAGAFENSKCGIEAINPGCSSGSCASSADDESLDGEIREDDYYEEEEGVPNSDDDEEGTYSSNCSRCEINYNRIRIDPTPPEGFDGSTCSGVAIPVDSSTIEGIEIESDDFGNGYLGGTAISTGTLLGGLNEEIQIGEDTIWTKIEESVLGRLAVLRATGCSPCKVLYFGEWLGGLYTKGKKKSWLNSVSGGLWGGGGTTARLYVQDEYMHAVTFFNERVSTWEKELEFTPKEGTVVRLEPRYEYRIDPRWTNIDEIIPDEIIDEYAEKKVLLEESIVIPHGLVPFEVTNSGCGEGYDTPDVNNTLVEYRNNGLIYAEIPADSIPDGLRLFLKGGYIYAEYIGDQSALQGNEINFSVSKVNLQGVEYAIVSVRDWVNGVKVERTFQVKLLGNPSNCFSLDGLAGLSGREFAPRLLFSWDWNGVSFDQCDSTNVNYTFCDATQFTISLFKRLELINNARLANNNKVLPKYSSFYAYLIKDGYSQDFLDDFDEYYSTTNFSSTGFNTTSTFTGYDLFLENMDFNIKTGSANVPLGNNGLPKGGLYRVEVETKLINPGINSLFDGERVNAKINITFTLINEAKNYNLFYETPFDGAVGRRVVNGSVVFDRQGYGSSLDMGQIPITGSGGNDSLMILNYSGNPLEKIKYSTSSNLGVLMNQKVLTYTKGSDNNKYLGFYPMQPTPVVLRIKGNSPNASTALRTIKAAYDIKGHGENLSVDRSWNMISSTLGNNGKCTDFLGNQTYSFTEKTNGSEKYFEWNNVSKSGTIELATTFFTPPIFEDASTQSSSGPTSLDVSSSYSDKVNLLTTTGNMFVSGTGFRLGYFDEREYNKYKSLKGIFEMISEGKLCISQNSLTDMQIWWNTAYLESLMESVAYNKSNSCID